MAQPRPDDRKKLEQILQLMGELSPDGREELVEQMKLQWLRQEIQVGLDQADRGEVVDGEQLLAELRQRAEARLKKSQ